MNTVFTDNNTQKKEGGNTESSHARQNEFFGRDLNNKSLCSDGGGLLSLSGNERTRWGSWTRVTPCG